MGIEIMLKITMIIGDFDFQNNNDKISMMDVHIILLNFLGSNDNG